MSEVIRLDAVRTDGGTQSRAGLNEQTIQNYMADMSEGDVFPAIEVIYDGEQYWCVDGFHRVEAARRLGWKEFPADLKPGTLEEAQWASYGANPYHGLARSNEDKRRAIVAALKHPRGAGLSDRQIGKHVHVDHKTVATVRERLIATGEIPQSVERVGADGRTINTANIGKPNARQQPELRIGYVVSVGDDVGVIIGVNNPRYPSKACVKRDNTVGFMTHWIAIERIVCPCDKPMETISATRVWQWRETLYRAYNDSKALAKQGGWLRRGTNEPPLNYDLIESGVMEWRDQGRAEESYRITEKGCEWLGLPEIEYPADDEQPAATFTAAAPVLSAGDRVITRTGHEGVVTEVNGNRHVLVETINGTRPHDRKTLRRTGAPLSEAASQMGSLLATRRGAQRARPAQLVLSLFPGADLLGRAFEAMGFCVVRGPEWMLGQDVRDFDVLPGRFDGVIGGPPCQPFSKAKVGEYSVHENLIPEFVRIVEQASPQWAVMENVPEAASAAPSWEHVFLKDWDCGGNTFRKRGFWFYGIPTPPVPQKRPGRAAYSVLATSWNIRKRSGKHNGLTAYEAARLQGYEDLATTLIERWPGTFCSNGKWSGVSGHSRNVLAVHMMGNGVPRALGEYVARHVAQVTCE